jgi:glycosyl transferase family 87
MEAVAAPLWSSRRVREGVAYLGLAGLAASSALIAMGAQGRLGVLVPAARLRYPDWLRGPLSGLQIALTANGLAWLLVGMCAGYVLVLVCAEAVSARVAIGTVVGLHVLFILGPPLVSTDVFGYIDLARLGTLHGISPYSPASAHIPPDSVHLYRRWHSDLPAPYGPVFMLIAYALVPLGVAGGLWAFKILAAAGSLATVWLVWRCAAALGRDPLKAALFVGLNPALLLFGVGGAHNDFLVLTVATAGVYLLIVGRDRLGGAGFVVASAMKLPIGLPLAFALARPDRRVARENERAAGRLEVAKGALLAVAAVAIAAVVGFGSHAAGFIEDLKVEQKEVAIYSVPNQVGKLLGFGGLTHGIRLVFTVALAATAVVMLRRAWRGADWIAAAGWTMFALLVASAWLLPWYVAWLLPLAAISSDRRLRTAALALTVYVVATRVTLWAGLPG